MDIWDVIIIICTLINITGIAIQMWYYKQRKTDMAVMSKINQENMDLVEQIYAEIENMKPKSPHMPTQEEIDELVDEQDEDE